MKISTLATLIIILLANVECVAGVILQQIGTLRDEFSPLYFGTFLLGMNVGAFLTYLIVIFLG